MFVCLLKEEDLFVAAASLARGFGADTLLERLSMLTHVLTYLHATNPDMQVPKADCDDSTSLYGTNEVISQFLFDMVGRSRTNSRFIVASDGTEPLDPHV